MAEDKMRGVYDLLQQARPDITVNYEDFRSGMSDRSKAKGVYDILSQHNQGLIPFDDFYSGLNASEAVAAADKTARNVRDLQLSYDSEEAAGLDDASVAQRAGDYKAAADAWDKEHRTPTRVMPGIAGASIQYTSERDMSTANPYREIYGHWKEEDDRRKKSAVQVKADTAHVLTDRAATYVQANPDSEYAGIIRHLNNQTERLYTAPSQYDGPDAVNYFEGVADGVSDSETWTGGVGAGYQRIIEVADKAGHGEYLSPDEEALMDAFMGYLDMQAARDDLPTGYKAGISTAQSVPFMLEMMLTGGVGAAVRKGIVRYALKRGGKEAAEKVAKYVANRAVRDAAGKMVVNDAAGKATEIAVKRGVGTRIADELASDIITTALMPQTHTAITRERINAALEGKDFSALDFARAWTSQMLEVVTERGGGQLIDMGLGKVFGGSLFAGSQFGRIVARNLQSPFGETGEEYENAIFNILRSFNPLYDDESNRQLRQEGLQMFTPEGFGQTFLSVVPMTLLMGGAATAINYSVTANKLSDARQRIIDRLLQSGAAPETAERLLSTLEQSADDSQYLQRFGQIGEALIQRNMDSMSAEELKQYVADLNKDLTDLMRAAYAYNEARSIIAQRYSELSDEDRAQVDKMLNDYVAQTRVSDESVAGYAQATGTTPEEVRGRIAAGDASVQQGLDDYSYIAQARAFGAQGQNIRQAGLALQSDKAAEYDSHDGDREAYLSSLTGDEHDEALDYFAAKEALAAYDGAVAERHAAAAEEQRSAIRERADRAGNIVSATLPDGRTVNVIDRSSGIATVMDDTGNREFVADDQLTNVLTSSIDDQMAVWEQGRTQQEQEERRHLLEDPSEQERGMAVSMLQPSAPVRINVNGQTVRATVQAVDGDGIVLHFDRPADMGDGAGPVSTWQAAPDVLAGMLTAASVTETIDNAMSRVQQEASDAIDANRKVIDEFVSRIGRSDSVVHLANDAEAAAQGIAGRGGKANAVYHNGKVYIYDQMLAGRSAKEALGTIIHELVAHDGARALLGTRFNDVMDRIWRGMSQDMQTRFVTYVARAMALRGDSRAEGWDAMTDQQRSEFLKTLATDIAVQREAADEYMAYLAEGVDLTEEEKTLWQEIVDIVKNFIDSILGKDVMGRAEVEQLIRTSYQSMRAQAQTKAKEQAQAAPAVETKAPEAPEAKKPTELETLQARYGDKTGQKIRQTLSVLPGQISAQEAKVKTLQDKYDALPIPQNDKEEKAEAAALKALNDAKDELAAMQDRQSRYEAMLKELETIADDKTQNFEDGSNTPEMQRRMQDWLNDPDKEWAEAKELGDIVKKFGNELEPIAYIPSEWMDSIFNGNVKDNRIYCGKGYFIDHAVNHHPEVDAEDYNLIQDILNNPDHVKDLGNGSIAFTKMLGKGYAVVVRMYNEKGRIVIHKSFFWREKNEPYKNKQDINKKSSVGGRSTISRTDVPGSPLSARDDFKGKDRPDSSNSNTSEEKNSSVPETDESVPETEESVPETAESVPEEEKESPKMGQNDVTENNNTEGIDNSEGKNNFAPNKQNENGRNGDQTGLDNTGAVEGSSSRRMVGEQSKMQGVYRTAEDANSGGDTSAVREAEEREELESRGINPDWDRHKFEREVKARAKENGVWISDLGSLLEGYSLRSSRSRGTSESDVYVSPDGKRTLKLNNLSYVRDSSRERGFLAFMDRIEAHNNLFPEVAYDVLGFASDTNGRVVMVMTQPFIEAERNATSEEITDYLSSKGFEMDGERVWSNGHPVWTNGVYEIFDARPANVLRGKEGGLYFIDTIPHSVAYMSATTPEARLADAEAATDTHPTDGQKEAGNYAKGHVRLFGMNLSIEQPKGSTRSGVDADGRAWSQEMHNTYGYIRGTMGRDKDHIDVFLGDNLESQKVFVVDQKNRDGSFDEHKVMLGFDSLEEARKAYLSNYEEGWQGLMHISETTLDEFRAWALAEGRRVKPFAEYHSVETLPKEEAPVDVELNGQLYNIKDLERQFESDIRLLLEDNGIEVNIKGVKLIGSRIAGSPRVDSDLDLLVEFEGDYSEDALFNILNDEAFDINGIKLDINPIKEGKSGTIAQFLERNRDFKKSTGEETEVRADAQGNPVGTDGKLILESVSSVDELTDDDFTHPTRSVVLPILPENVSSAVGITKPLIIKKNVFEKNRDSHKDLTASDSRKILREVLYSPDLYGQNQKITRPYNWILIHLADKNEAVIIEVNDSKDNTEIVNWHYLRGNSLEQKKKQAINEGGLILTFSKENAAGNAVDNLRGKDTANSNSSSTKPEKTEEKSSAPKMWYESDKSSAPVYHGKGSAAKFNILKFVEDAKSDMGKLHPAITGVFHHRGEEVATSRSILIARRASYDRKLENRITGKKGEVIEGRYPNYTIIFPKEVKGTVAVEDMRAAYENAKLLRETYPDEFGKKTPVQLSVPTSNGESVRLSDIYVKLFLDLFDKSGGQPVITYHGSNRALTIEGSDYRALMMPMTSSDTYVTATEAYADGEKRELNGKADGSTADVTPEENGTVDHKVVSDKRRPLEQYLEGRSQLERSRITATLSMKLNYEGKVLTRSEFIEGAVGKGLKFHVAYSNGRPEYRVDAPGTDVQGAFNVITKTEYDYAAYLGGAMPSPEEQSAEKEKDRYRALGAKFEYADTDSLRQRKERLEKWSKSVNVNTKEGKRVLQDLADITELINLREKYSQKSVMQGQTQFSLAEPLRPLKKGEKCYVERKFTEDHNFSFTGKDRIESLDDIAYIFRSLADTSIENSFLVFTDKDGKATVVHAGMGTDDAVNVDLGSLSVLAGEAEKIYMVHNHPSGNLKPSMQDRRMLENLVRLAGDKVQEGVIIDGPTTDYCTFDTGEGSNIRTMAEPSSEVDYKTYKFDKSVFDKEYNPSKSLRSAPEVAGFISSQRLGERSKIGVLTLDRQLHVRGNFFLPSRSLSDTESLAGELSRYASATGAYGVVLFGTGITASDKDRRSVEALRGRMTATLVDVLAMGGENTPVTQLLLSEGYPEMKYTAYSDLREQAQGGPVDLFQVAEDVYRKQQADERQAIKERALADGTFMKAPNGKPTKLSEDQWLTVRTRAFKRWFGDWELSELKAYLLGDNVVESLTGEEFKKEVTPLTERVAKFYDEKYGGHVTRDGFGDVILDGRSVKDSLSHGLGRLKSAAFAAVPSIITKGRIIDGKSQYKGRNQDSYIFAAPIKIGEENYIGIVIVTRGKETGKNRFYLHEVILQKNLQNENFKTDNKAGSHSGDIAKLLNKIILANNSSKIIDENGEPLVVYHGTTNYFNVFKTYEESGIRNQFDELPSEAFMFTEDPHVASDYGDPIEVFLNSTNPLDVREKTELVEVVKAETGFLNSLAPADLYLDEENIEDFIRTYIDSEGRLYRVGGGSIKEDSECWWAIQQALIDYAKENGYDSVIFKDSTRGEGHDSIGVFEGDQIKSAEPFTFDDNGELIPLSERFSDSNDLRFQMSDEEASEASFGTDRFSIVTDKAELDRLNGYPEDGYITAYASMAKIGGKYYAPMATKSMGRNGRTSLTVAMSEGDWTRSEERTLDDPDVRIGADGHWEYHLRKPKGAMWVAYNPYFHSTRSPLNDQFTAAHDRPELVLVEVRIPKEDLDGYRAEGAKDKVSETGWHEGPVSAMLAGTPDERKVILSRYRQIVREVPVQEEARLIADILSRHPEIRVPINVVRPELREALHALGVKFGPIKGNAGEAAEKLKEILNQYNSEDRMSLTPEQVEETLTGISRTNAKRYDPSGEDRFQITRRNDETIDRLLAKNENIDAKGVAAFKTYVENDDPVAQLSMAKWFGNGSVRLPEDRPLVDEALKICRKDKLDPMSFSNPGDIVADWRERNLPEEEERQLLSPDAYPGVLTNKVDYGNGITVYNVMDNAQGQQAVRDLMNDHLTVDGKYYNCWCLEYANDRTGALTEQAKTYWGHYHKCPKRVAFYNGAIIAFCASDSDRKAEWWDLSDKSHGRSIPVTLPIPGDKYSRSSMAEFDEDTKESAYTSLKFSGNKKNGLYREWDGNDNLVLSVHYKGGKTDGLSEIWYENGQLKVRINYKDGERDGLFESWYADGQLEDRINFKDGKRDGLFESWYADGQLMERATYKDGLLDGLSERWRSNGQLWIRANYKGGKQDGLSEAWYENGQLERRTNYKNGSLNGFYESWYENGQLERRTNYKEGFTDGLSEAWYENGQLEDRINFKDGKRDGLFESWYADGQLWIRANYKDGQLKARATYKDGKLVPSEDRMSLTPETDAEYMDAVNARDLSRAQALVDAAARAAGYNVRATHNTPNLFTRFDSSLRGSNTGRENTSSGFFFLPADDAIEEGNREQFGQNRMDVYLRMQNPIDVTTVNDDVISVLNEYIANHPDSEAITAEELYDELLWGGDLESFMAEEADVFNAGYDSMIGNFGDGIKEYIVHDPSQIKSAETVTYDNDGNAIPLSERFNSEGDDIRFQMIEKAEQFITESLKGNKRNKSFKLMLPESTLSRIKTETGIEYDSHNIDANSFVHAKREHGIGGKKITERSIPLRDDDFCLAPSIMIAPDRIERGGTDMTGRESIRFIKYLSNGVVIVVEKEQKNSPIDMDTITMWADVSDGVIHGSRPGSTIVQNVITTIDAAKIRSDAKKAMLESQIFQISNFFGGNSGYVGYSKSRRAVAAENEGKRSISNMDDSFRDEVNAILAKAGAPEVSLNKVRQAAKNARPDEWHHTSKYGNRTNYYSPETVARQLMTSEQEEAYDEMERREWERWREDNARKSALAEAEQERISVSREKVKKAAGEVMLEEGVVATSYGGHWLNRPEGSIQLDEFMKPISFRYSPDYQKSEARKVLQSLAGDLRRKVLERAGVTEEELVPASFQLASPARTLAAKFYEDALKQKTYRFTEGHQDSMRSLLLLQRAVERATGRELKDYENAYLHENAMSSKNQAQSEQYERQYIRPLQKAVDDLIALGASRKQVITYMMAKHGLERNALMSKRYGKERDYSGLTQLTGSDTGYTSAAQKMVDDFEAAYDTRVLWAKTNAATKATLKTLHDGGLMSNSSYEDTRSMYDYYIPLRGWDETVASDVYEYLQEDGGRYGSVLKKAKGRTSVADDPIATIAWMGSRGIMQANRNLMKQKFLNMAINTNTDLLSVRRGWVVLDPATGEWHTASADIPAGADGATAQQAIDDFEASMTDLEKQGLARRMDEKLDVAYRVLPSEASQHAVMVQEGGHTWTVYVNGDPRAAQAVNGLLNPDVSDSKIEQGVASMNRFMAANFTQRNPAFVLTNMSRDMIFSNFAVDVKEKAPYRRSFLANQLSLLKDMPGLVARQSSGKLDRSNPLDAMYLDFIENGGQTGYSNMLTVEQYKEKMGLMGRTHLRRAFDTVESATQYLAAPIALMNQMAENISRFAAFMTSRQAGRSLARSVWDAKEVTVNFNKKGSGVAGARYMRGLFLFYNAAMQSLAQFGKLAKHHPGQFYPRIALLVTAGALMPLLCKMVIEACGGDPDDYYSLPETVRRNNIVLPMGDSGKYVTIPMPIELRAFYGLGGIFTDAMSGQMRHDNVGLAVAGQFTDLLPLDIEPMLRGSRRVNDWGEAFLNVGATMGPDAFRPLFQMARNEDYFGLPIYRKNDFNDDMPAYTKAYKGTGRMYVSLSELLNESTGGDKYTPGAIDLNPAAIEFILGAYFGGTYKTLQQTVNTVGNIAEGDVQWRGVPVLNRFVSSTKDSRVYGRRINNAFFDYKDRADLYRQRLNGYLKEAGTGSYEYAEKLSEMYSDPWFAAGEYLKSVDRRLKGVSDMEKAGAYTEREATEEKLRLREEAVEWLDEYFEH